VGISGLLGSARSHDLFSDGLRGPVRFVDIALKLTFVILMIVSLAGRASEPRSGAR
jgi:hypothetical protein